MGSVLIAAVGGWPAPAGAEGRTPEPAAPETPSAPVADGGSKTAEQVLQQAEQWVILGQDARAGALLEAWIAEGGDDSRVVWRLARLYRDMGRFEELDALITRQLQNASGSDTVALRRLLAEARFERGRRDEAMAQLQAIVDSHPDEESYARMVASILRRHDENAAAIEVLLQARSRSGDPGVFAQQLGVLYAEEGRVVEAAGEFTRVIVDHPMNLALMRSRILDLLADRPEQAEAVVKVVEEAAAGHPDVPQLRLLLAELDQMEGNEEEARASIDRLMADASMSSDLLQTARSCVAESRLPDLSAEMTRRKLYLSQTILTGLLRNGRLGRSLQAKAYETLVQSWLALLESEGFDALPRSEKEEALNGFRRTILDMARRFPHDQGVTASLLRLSGAYIDELHRPDDAIALLRRIQVDPNASKVQLHAARMELGRAWMAAGDTTRARSLFEKMGQDMDFVEGQGRAHYHLGQLDLMGGHFQRAKERLSAVAFESPSADYTNDALQLALVLAEELMGKNDQEGLRHFGRALYFRITAADDSLRAELEAMSRSESTVLRSRALLELARDDLGKGNEKAAIASIDRLLSEDPESRQVPIALELKGDLLLRTGRPGQARRIWEGLLEDHEDYVFAERVRDKIRALTSSAKASGKKKEDELP